jgi:protein gp37
MCDIFSPGVDRIWIEKIIETVRTASQHTFMFLSKNPIKYYEYYWPVNAWLGATVESRSKLHRLDTINVNKNNHRFVSIEPILGPFQENDFKGMDLVIVGRDSSPKAKFPYKDWITSINHPNVHIKKDLKVFYHL